MYFNTINPVEFISQFYVMISVKEYILISRIILCTKPSLNMSYFFPRPCHPPCAIGRDEQPVSQLVGASLGAVDRAGLDRAASDVSEH